MSALIIFITVSLLTISLFVVERFIFYPFKGTGERWLHHSDYNGRHVTFKSKHNQLSGWFYGENNACPKGLIIFSHGMGVASEYYLPEILYYAGKGYKVFAFDNTGYGANRGQFLGFSQAVFDLKCAIDYADDGALPVTLIGHSMGGYAVCCVLKRLNLSEHNIKNIVTYAALDNLPEVALDFLNARGSLIRTLLAKIICFGQFLLFGTSAYLKASDMVDKNQQIQFIMIHGDKDDEIDINTASVISKKCTNPNVTKMIISDPEINTHMGVVRKNGMAANGINKEIVERIAEKL
ncbi:MAG: alpha/beta fold hydrolase [Clostridia bacterium]|nr:alpha/beta fold hydrolase [Clostridia bacterium]